jgi:hypothetical protein
MVLARVSFDEVQNALPGIGGGFGVLIRAPIKEAVRRTRIDDDLVFNSCTGQLLVKALDIAGRNALIGTSKEAKRRVVDLCGLIEQGSSTPKVAGHASIEADYAVQSEFGCAGQK